MVGAVFAEQAARTDDQPSLDPGRVSEAVSAESGLKRGSHDRIPIPVSQGSPVHLLADRSAQLGERVVRESFDQLGRRIGILSEVASSRREPAWLTGPRGHPDM